MQECLYIYWEISGQNRHIVVLGITAPGIRNDFCDSSVYFLISFFQTEKEKLKTRETKLLSGCFALAFSLTLAIHFYGTMIAGLCCIGIAVGFCPRFLNKEYFKRIMMTGIISVFLAVLPMGIAFAGGTPLQGSLGWGLSVINGGKSDTEDSEDKTTRI